MDLVYQPEEISMLCQNFEKTIRRLMKALVKGFQNCTSFSNIWIVLKIIFLENLHFSTPCYYLLLVIGE